MAKKLSATTLKPLKRVPPGKTALRSPSKAMKQAREALLKVFEGYDYFSGEAMQGVAMGALSVAIDLVSGNPDPDWSLATGKKMYAVLEEEIRKRESKKRSSKSVG